MSNKKKVELTDITAPLLAATQGLTREDRDAIGRLLNSDDETTDSLPDLGLSMDYQIFRNRRKNPRPPSISKISRNLRNLSESSFHPQLVSIGPIHIEDPKLQELEWLKECYLDDLLHRCDSTPKKTLEACLLKVNTLIPEIRESYAGVKNYSDAELARMMVMDGCFILEFCFKHEDDEENLYLPNTMQNFRIAMDLMLLENQVPFSVLQALFDCCVGEAVSFTLSNVLDRYLAPYINLSCSRLPEHTDTVVIVNKSDSTPDHVLGYLHNYYQLIVAKSLNPTDAEASKLADEERRENICTAHSIVELDRAGMDFKPNKEYSWSMTVNSQPSLFPCLPSSKPDLLMPTLVIDDSTEQILRNFIAYEQLFRQDNYYFTSYAHAMNMLIDTQEDIAKLVESKVLVNRLGSNQEAADMINKICKNISIIDFNYIQAFEQMDKYYNGWSSTYFAWLKRAYANNPFFFIALTAAIILFLLTVVQTLFTVLGYFADGSNQ